MTIPKPIRVERGAGGAEEPGGGRQGPGRAPNSRSSSPAAASSCRTARPRRSASPSISRRPVVTSYLHNDAFPASHPLMCGPLGYQGSKAAMKLIAAGRCGAGAGHPPRALRHPAPARHRLLAEERQDHPGRQRPPHAGAGEADQRRRLRRCQGGGRGDPDPAGDHERGHRLPRQQGPRASPR